MSPARPGAREARGGIAFNVCVNPVAPALKPARPCSYVAVEWPIETFMPWDVRVLIKEDESGSSGARVASLMAELRFEESKVADGEVEHGWKREALWAPFLVGWR